MPVRHLARCYADGERPVLDLYYAPPEAAAAEAALLFFAFFFEALLPDASAGALAAAAVAGAAVAGAADASEAALLFFFDFEVFGLDASAGVAAVVAGGGAAAGAAAGAALVVALDVFAAGLAPVGADDEPLMVRPAASRLVTDLVPMPLTRVARSSAFLNGPFLVRSSMIALAWTGPMPFTDSSVA